MTNQSVLKKRNMFILPSQDFCYGKTEAKDPFGVEIVTRSWIVSVPSKKADPPQDFVKINKLAVKLNVSNYMSNKEFRNNVDIKKKIVTGGSDKKIYLPDVGFRYGRANRVPTPVKKIINYHYGNKAEDEIRKSYSHFMYEKKRTEKFEPRTTKTYEKLKKFRQNEKIQEEKENNNYKKKLYKIPVFKAMNSKVKNSLEMFNSFKNSGSNGMRKSCNMKDSMVNSSNTKEEYFNSNGNNFSNNRRNIRNNKVLDDEFYGKEEANTVNMIKNV